MLRTPKYMEKKSIKILWNYFPMKVKKRTNGFTTPKIKLINKENEIEVGIGEFPNNPLNVPVKMKKRKMFMS